MPTTPDPRARSACTSYIAGASGTGERDTSTAGPSRLPAGTTRRRVVAVTSSVPSKMRNSVTTDACAETTATTRSHINGTQAIIGAGGAIVRVMDVFVIPIGARGY